MNGLFEKYIGRGVEIYMDDIVIYGRTRKVHDDLLLETIKILERSKMRINLKKVQLCQREIKLLGVTLNGEMITPSEIKQNEALEFPKPQNVSDVRRFLGLSG
ncbi:Retrovirus-related Pol polyprotein from transposon opus [Nosema granulosis]|uniref:Retrovirus-related Pol polyprotein from transposon opus n=1 Tax=Nosema granulosis TaxID=83296 RepID=A0A9P6GWD9_9MICR|nr:Retrovirus-related Pol polyprotein from transposon opus [Nosema granulosis]